MPATIGPSRQTPSRWKRLLYSILSILFCAILASFAASLAQLWHLPRFDLRLVFLQTSVVSVFTLVACLPGWLLALGFILTITDFHGWRFFATWALGTAIGPLVVLGFSLFLFMSTSGASTFFYPAEMAWFAVAIACSATLLYLLLIRHSQRRAARIPATNTPPARSTP